MVVIEAELIEIFCLMSLYGLRLIRTLVDVNVREIDIEFIGEKYKDYEKTKAVIFFV